MWRCPQCHETVEAQFTACWNCGFEPEDASANAPEPPPLPMRPSPPLCEACDVPLDPRGEIPIRVGGPEEGFHWFREWDELGERLWRLQVFVCPHCKRVTFYEMEDEED